MLFIAACERLANPSHQPPKHIGVQQFEIWINFSNKEGKFVVLIVLREAQNDKNNKELSSYFALLLLTMMIIQNDGLPVLSSDFF